MYYSRSRLALRFVRFQTRARLPRAVGGTSCCSDGDTTKTRWLGGCRRLGPERPRNASTPPHWAG